MEEYDIIIVGSGAGMNIVDPAVNAGHKVALVESGPLGGTCLNRGCIPSKMWIYPADVIREMEDAAKIGVYARLEKADFDLIRRRTWDVVLHDRGHIEEAVKTDPRLKFYHVQGAFVGDHAINKKAIEGLDIEFSLFTKTHTPNHIEVVNDVFLTLKDKGYLYTKGTQQYYCPRCEKFLPDRYVEGKCPFCGNEKARGDQCEKCGKTFEGGELENATCLHCGTEPEKRETEQYFLKLSEFQEPLIQWISGKENWKSSVKLFTRNWLETGLHDRSVTRDMAWGIPVPLPGWEGKVIYVWFDAVIGYLSASKEWAKAIGRPDEWKAYWQDPSVRSYYFLGKDNIPFHTIIWPAMLMGYGGLNLPFDVPANEFLTFKGDKLSKSRGNSIDIPSMLEKFEVDAIRYYVSVNMPENKDSDFSWSDFETKVNNELVATLGNFYHRVLSFTYKHYGVVPEYKGSDADRREVMDAIEAAQKQVAADLEVCEFKRALKSVMDLAQFGNRYFDSVGPWALIKKDREACGSALNLNLELVKALAVMSYPFMPRSAKGAWKLLGQEGDLESAGWKAIGVALQGQQKLLEPKPLFSKISVEKDEADSVFKGFSTLNLRVGQIIEAGNHPNADSLLLMQVDIGKKVQIVAGLKAYYSPEELKGRKVVVVSNLKPAKLRGYESQGMRLMLVKGLRPSLAASPRIHSWVADKKMIAEGVSRQVLEKLHDRFDRVAPLLDALLGLQAGHVRRYHPDL